MAKTTVPIVATIIGEGGSGGALALAVANQVNVLEYGTYSVISPEGCASILWKDATKADEAASSLKITARELLELGVVDKLIAEPPGGAHQNVDETALSLDRSLQEALASLLKMSPVERKNHRYDRFRRIGTFEDLAVKS